jgi:HSP20 family protein
MLMRFDPFRDLDALSQMFNNQAGAARRPVMPMDAWREGDQFYVMFDLPGVNPDSIELTVEKNVLTVRAERRWEPNENHEVLVAERPQGVFSRQLFLGESLDADRIQASYENGVLALTIPIAEQAKPRRVEISAQGAGNRTIGASSTTAGQSGSNEPSMAGAGAGTSSSGDSARNS